jgi:hypothetical protein
MSGKPAMFREREGKRVIALAKRAGAREVEFRYGDVTAIVRLDESDEKDAAPSDVVNEWLINGAH